MNVASAQRAVPTIALDRCLSTPAVRAPTTRTVMAIDSIGYLVPRGEFAGRIHSVFARACNVACGSTLLTVCAPEAGNGPTTLSLAPTAAIDLRDHFDVAEPVRCRDGRLRSRGAELILLRAAVWDAPRSGPLLPRARIDKHLRDMQHVLGLRRAACNNVLDDAAAPVTAALGEACRALDRERAARGVERVVGWGEGLTPAGDDFLVGLLAGLDALASGVPERRSFHEVLAATLVRNASRTTPIASHCLRLAAGGHHGERLIRLRNALTCDGDGAVVATALQGVLAVGASSGADTVSGLVAGLRAWLPAASTAEGA